MSPSVRLQTKKLEMFAKESLSSALAPSYLDTGTTRILSLVGKLSRGPGSFHSCYCISRYLVFADKGQKKLFSLVENLGSKETRFPERMEILRSTAGIFGIGGEKSHLNEADRKSFREAFNNFDWNGNGKISYGSLLPAMR